MRFSQVRAEAFQLAGGLDLVSPALAMAPGMLISCNNFEPDINGGYRRMFGRERFDGRPSPSNADYWNVPCTITGTVSVGDTITGVTSLKTAVVLLVGSNEMIVTKATGLFVSESFTIGGIGQGTVLPSSINAGQTPLLHATYKGLAANNYRADISKPAGSGVARGVFRIGSDVYSFKDNAGGTAGGLFKATTSGWASVALGTEIQFTAGNVATPVDGAVLTQGGVTATVARVLTRSGTWTGTAVGTFVITNVAGGHFGAGAATLTGGATVTLSGIETAITLLPGGRYEFDTINFSGTLSTRRIYGCDGVNRMFEFDGTTYVPIRTGIAGDNPSFLCGHKNCLFMAVGSSVQVSGVGKPYSWTALTGAAELALGDVCTGLLPQLGSQTFGALAIFTKSKTFVLYGNSTADFNMVIQSPDVGAQPYTTQNILIAYMLDTRGVTQINATKNYGNFEMSTLTRAIQPLIDSKRGLATASCIVRSSNQYRLFFNDGTGLIVYLVAGDNGPIVGAIMPFDTGSTTYMNTVYSCIDEAGLEHVYACGSDGYVYELDKGTSQDGENLTAFFLTAFNSSKSPRTRKRYRRAVIQATCKNTAQVSIGYDLSFGGNEAQVGMMRSSVMVGTGGYWDSFIWDQFTWDAPYVNEYTIDTPGDGRNISIMLINDTAIDEPFTVHSAITSYMAGRQER